MRPHAAYSGLEHVIEVEVPWVMERISLLLFLKMVATSAILWMGKRRQCRTHSCVRCPGQRVRSGVLRAVHLAVSGAITQGWFLPGLHFGTIRCCRRQGCVFSPRFRENAWATLPSRSRRALKSRDKFQILVPLVCL